MTERTASANLFSITELDRLVHEPARLAIMALLYVLESADSTFCMNQTGLTWGNFSTHMSKLDKAGYLEVVKSYKGRRPSTTLKLTATGRQAFQTYLERMNQVIKDYST